LMVAGMNMVILLSVYRAFRHVKAGHPYREEMLRNVPAARGIPARLFRPVFGMIRCSWHMYPLGFLFGLGFDTATEVGLLGLSAGAATKHVPFLAILSLPLLFAAGMSLLDTADGAFMAHAYGWAFSNPVRKVYYNLTL